MSVGYRITAILSRKLAHRVTKETSIPLFWMAHGEPMRSPARPEYTFNSHLTCCQLLINVAKARKLKTSSNTRPFYRGSNTRFPLRRVPLNFEFVSIIFKSNLRLLYKISSWKQRNPFHDIHLIGDRWTTDTIVPSLPGSPRGSRKIDASRILELRKLHAVHAEIDVVSDAKGPLAVVQTSKQYEQYPPWNRCIKYWLAISLIDD